MAEVGAGAGVVAGPTFYGLFGERLTGERTGRDGSYGIAPALPPGFSLVRDDGLWKLLHPGGDVIAVYVSLCPEAIERFARWHAKEGER